ncbi:MAG TPA: hypothetical protein VLF41_00490 [Candidatus Nanoarchaeia archaeon]|nr:hypothetical protein [Candidatus Nanoarchaeia archaeon]
MKKMQKTKRLVSKLLVLVLSFWTIISLLPASASAVGVITQRSVTLSNSAVGSVTAGQGVTYTAVFNLASMSTPVKSVKIEVCDVADPSQSCVNPTGFAITSASNLASQPTGLGSATGWTGASTTSNPYAFKATHATNATNPTNPVTIVFNSVTNPTTTNQAFYLRIHTFSDSAYTTEIDKGVVAVSTANQLTLHAYVPETLTFCIYQAASASPACPSNITSNTVDFGTLSVNTVKTGNSFVECSSNATNGYQITYSGATLTQGIRTIAAAGSTAVASSPGSEQFGFNAVANTTPAIGANPTGTAPIGRAISAADGGQYATPDSFAFDTASVTTPVAFADSGNPATPTNKTIWTLSWIANIAGITAAGDYTTTITFVATANF